MLLQPPSPLQFRLPQGLTDRLPQEGRSHASTALDSDSIPTRGIMQFGPHIVIIHQVAQDRNINMAACFAAESYLTGMSLMPSTGPVALQRSLRSDHGSLKIAGSHTSECPPSKHQRPEAVALPLSD